MDDHFGTQVPDPCRHLEKGESATTRQWTDAQNAKTDAVVNAFKGRPVLERQYQKLLNLGRVGLPVAQGTGKSKAYFYTRRDPGQNQPVLYVQDNHSDNERVLLDVNTLSTREPSLRIGGIRQPKGNWITYVMSSNGSGQSTLYVKSVERGKTRRSVSIVCPGMLGRGLPVKPGFTTPVPGPRDGS